MPGTCTMQAPRSTRARRGFRWQQALERKTAPLEDAASQAFALCERWSRARTALTAAKLRKVSEVLALQDPVHSRSSCALTHDSASYTKILCVL